MANVNVNVTSHVKEVLDELDNAKDRALTTIGLLAERHAKGYCPVDTGRLRNSITFATSKSQGSANGSPGTPADPMDYKMQGTPSKDTVVLGTNVGYAPHIELGGSKKAPEGFLRPAVMNHMDEYRKAAESALKGKT